MDINTLLKGVDCTCGQKHTCGIGAVHIEKNAAARLTDLCRDYENILLVCDENTYAAAGYQVTEALMGKTLGMVRFPGDKVLVPDEAAIADVTELVEGKDVIIAIGSGVIQDLCKYVSWFHHSPYIVVATAPSMDGYASNGAAMITGGMKVTYACGLPMAILADTEVLRSAPMDMIKAGYGDIIGKFSALNDWRLSHAVNGEPLCSYIYDTTMEQVEKTVSLADGLLHRDAESVRALMEALVVIGIMMRFAGSSRPASGSEHHLSHYFEVTGLIDGTSYFSHGLDVAYSTVITANIREALVAKAFPAAIFCPEKETYRQEMTGIYKQVAPGFMALQEKLGTYEKELAPVYLAKEQEIKKILADCPTGAKIRELLALADIHMDDFYALYDEEKIANAIKYAKDIKDRYTVLWLNYHINS